MADSDNDKYRKQLDKARITNRWLAGFWGAMTAFGVYIAIKNDPWWVGLAIIVLCGSIGLFQSMRARRLSQQIERLLDGKTN